MTDPSLVYLRTKAGRIHRGTLDVDRVLVDERCGLDQAPGAEERLDALPEDVEPAALCGFCFDSEHYFGGDA